MPTITVAQAIPLIKKEGRKNVISLEYRAVYYSGLRSVIIKGVLYKIVSK